MTSSFLDAHQLKKLRPLGALEKFSSARHHLGFYHNVGISSTYASPSHSPTTLKYLIFSALSIVIARHPILSAIPIDEDTPSPYFARLPSINLCKSVTFLTRQTPLMENDNKRDAELDELLEEQHNMPFKANYGELPFWRLIVLVSEMKEGKGSEFVASFIFHHALGDGTTGLIFHKHFLSALQSAPLTLDSTTVPSPYTDLLPNLELAHTLPISTSHLAEPPKGIWGGAKISSTPMKSNLHSLVIAKPVTDALVRACRAHSTTLTATVPVIIASALAQSPALPQQYESFECCIPVNLRRWLPDSFNDDAMGTFIDAFSQYYSREQLAGGFSWSEAQRSKEMIKEYLNSDGQRVNVAKFKLIPDMGKWLLEKVDKERGSSFDVSNLGGLPAGEDDEKGWNMGRMLFSRSAFVSGSAFSTGLVTGPDGCLVLGFCWQEGIVERTLLLEVIEKVRSEIEQVAEYLSD